MNGCAATVTNRVAWPRLLGGVDVQEVRRTTEEDWLLSSKRPGLPAGELRDELPEDRLGGRGSRPLTRGYTVLPDDQGGRNGVR